MTLRGGLASPQRHNVLIAIVAESKVEFAFCLFLQNSEKYIRKKLRI